MFIPAAPDGSASAEIAVSVLKPKRGTLESDVYLDRWVLSLGSGWCYDSD